MNYRHAYHAGNFADVMKHVLLLELMSSLQRKEGGACVIDTHAGCGEYDLRAEEAEKTQEWRQGLGRVLEQPDAVLQSYIDRVTAFGAPARYPGSPRLIASMLRPQDRLIACELHTDDAQILRRLFHRDDRVAVHHRDGYASLRAFLPPRPQKRGLVLIDPPFEKPDEFARLADAIAEIRTRFHSGIVAAWYPIKHRTPVRAFHDDLKARGVRSLLACELTLRPPLDPTRLNGSGLLIANPPFGFDNRARELLAVLARILDIEGQTTAQVEWLVGE